VVIRAFITARQFRSHSAQGICTSQSAPSATTWLAAESAPSAQSRGSAINKGLGQSRQNSRKASRLQRTGGFPNRSSRQDFTHFHAEHISTRIGGHSIERAPQPTSASGQVPGRGLSGEPWHRPLHGVWTKGSCTASPALFAAQALMAPSLVVPSQNDADQFPSPR